MIIQGKRAARRKRFQELLGEFEEAVRADEMKGAGYPEDKAAIELGLKVARYKLQDFFDSE